MNFFLLTRQFHTSVISQMKSKVWVVSSHPQGIPKEDNFQCIEEELPPCKDDEIIIQAEALSVDPYMRYRIRTTEIGKSVIGGQVARVVESKNDKFPLGSYVVGFPGWRTHTHYSKEGLQKVLRSGNFYPYHIKGLPKSYGVGVLGLPGNTAYFGFLDICQPKPGDTVLVSGAAGAVGSLVCQIAKIKGCKVIAFAGSQEKLKYLKEIGCDHVFNYKTDDIADSLQSAAPKGINCYFDNVGGEFTAKVMPFMAEFSRVSVCGAISKYNDEEFNFFEGKSNGCFNEFAVVVKQIKIEGFIVTRWADRWMEGILQMKKWIEEGKIKCKETSFDGFENMPKAFIGLFHGDNIGKAIVRINTDKASSKI